ncbi:MAG: glycoside hydrolase family 15 protein [Nitrososphaerota archaeon]|nr:glycoside hydrolase family 15 protein [Nitrososphaerota archaeon]MDG6940130.1 glycoside hydrolase family 15 protein [Nitrososphaerota archaeon]
MERNLTFKLPREPGYKPIRGYGIVGNTRSVALAGYDGSIDWCCLPRFDSPSVFAAILDAGKGGRWEVQPVGGCAVEQRYVPGTNVLQTFFKNDEGSVTLTDFMPCRERGIWSAPPEIHRVAACDSGRMKMRLLMEPRFDYGRVRPRMVRRNEGFVISSSRHEMVFSSSLRLPTVADGAIAQEFELTRGGAETFVLSYGESIPRKVGEYHTQRWLDDTIRFWRDWVASLTYKGEWKDAVIRSALLLRLLVFSPTGAIVAAPTTSLPESVGGQRNWDYRFSWIRDSAFSLWAFHVVGSRSLAEDYLHWLIDSNPALDLTLQPLYTLDGKRNAPEKELKNLEGYMKSSPVRIGNAASRQSQMDAHGCILDALYFSSKHGSGVSDEMYFRFVKPLAHYIAKNWRKPGNGIWEVRNGRKQFVYTKVWCYVGLDRAVRIARMTGHPEDAEPWVRVMDEIKAEVLTKGWSEEMGTFKMEYDDHALDSANLMMPLVGFLPASDPRVVSTIEAIRKGLSEHGLLRRYKAADGFSEGEGSFMICNFWLVGSLARADRLQEARELFERLLSLGNHLGLYSEEMDAASGEMLGNFPQAFSHMGLIMAASELTAAARRAKRKV